MRTIFLIIVFFYAVLALVPYHQVEKNNRIENEFAFVFKFDLEDIVKSNYVNKIHEKGGVVLNQFEIGRLEGLFVRLPPSLLLEHLKDEDSLRYIEENQIIVTQNIVAANQSCKVQEKPIWNLERISERIVDIVDSKGYTYVEKAGEGVHSYIIDTGVYLEHEEFEGRAVWGINTIDSTNADCNGHGTHVAGTVIGKLYGVAKKTTVVAVKVLNCSGAGSINSVLTGIQYVTSHAKKPANANMSVGGGNSAVLIEAVEESIKSGIVYVVAAGGSNANACNYSPGNAPNALTVGATTIDSPDGSTTQQDVRASSSNWGICLDIFAPGQLIQSAWIGSPDATNQLSGTSMAAPHVSGVVSLIQGLDSTITPAGVRNVIVGLATPNIIDLSCTVAACNNSPNLLLYSNCTA